MSYVVRSPWAGGAAVVGGACGNGVVAAAPVLAAGIPYGVGAYGLGAYGAGAYGLGAYGAACGYGAPAVAANPFFGPSAAIVRGPSYAAWNGACW